MTEKRRTPAGSESGPQTPSVLSGLPRSRPHRRSEKRAGNGGATAAEAPETGAKAGAAARKAPAAKAPAPKAPAAKAPAAKAPAAKAATPKARAAKAATSGAAAPKSSARSARGQIRQPPQPRGVPEAERRSAPETGARKRPDRGGRRDLVATAVQAAAELTEIGLSAGARVLRDAVSRLPRR